MLLLAVLATSGKAQTMYDALRFSESNYEGTARTMAMGNAFTALGGDPGAVSINPAGSAVARYSQITITPSLNFSSNISSGTVLPGDTSPYSFGRSMKNSRTNFGIPNAGVVLNFDTHRTGGIKNVSVGFVINATNRWQDGLSARGANEYSSFMGALAAGSTGYDISVIDRDDSYDKSNIPWSTILGVKSGMISNISGTNDYVGASEKILEDTEGNKVISLGGPLDQSYQRQQSGSKYDYVLNAGMNISDILYLGANIGATSFAYSSSEQFTEAAQDPDDFEIIFKGENEEDIATYFSDMRYNYEYRATGGGAYFKFGFIVTPFAGLRLGGAIQTPTVLHITEYWQESAATYFTDASFDANAKTPEGHYQYRLTSPFRFNFGAAYTLGNFALLSADYEYTDYRSMRFKSNDRFSDEFDWQNQDIRDFMGAGHNFRAGLEIKPIQPLAIRAGYNLLTSPEHYYDEFDMKRKVKANRHTYSFGLGYSSKGSFYLDAACTATKYADEYVYPYNDYLSDMPSPEILSRKMLWKAVLTFGFRF